MSGRAAPAPVVRPIAATFVASIVWVVAVAYALALSEWLFFATKPSTVSVLPTADQWRVLALSPLPMVAWGVTATAVLLAVTALAGRGRVGVLRHLAVFVPVVGLTVLAFLLVENFTYTVFGWNVATFDGPGRFVYAAAFVACVAWSGRRVSRSVFAARPADGGTLRAIAALVVVATSIGVAVVPGGTDRPVSRDVGPGAVSAPDDLPNVLLLSSDGISASHMSLYGYERATTPFIDSLARESLVFENHFSNANRTTGAIGALITGRLPTQTHVIARPDTFSGVDAYRHLPGILRRAGYHAGDFSVRHFADAYDLNLRGGFHIGNGRSISDARASIALPDAWRAAYPATSLFVEQVADRIAQRVGHAFGVLDMRNPYEVVTEPPDDAFGSTFADAMAFIETAPRPFFAHVHLMGTHGPRFSPTERVFSKNATQDRIWMDEFYDDAILDFDRYVERVVAYLRETGELDDTLLVLNSDHGKRWGADALPLVIRLPGAARTGRRTVNSQRIDIPATVLDVLGIEIPDWMSGESLLREDLDPLRPIVSATRTLVRFEGGVPPIPEPPFFTLAGLRVTSCHHVYALTLATNLMTRTSVRNHTAPCVRSAFRSRREAGLFLVDHLERNGYDVSSLRGE